MKERVRRLFLGRSAYRRRRVADATRIVPILFAMSALVPPIWFPQHFSYARGAIWLAIAWTITIVVTALLHRALAGTSPTEDEDDA